MSRQLAAHCIGTAPGHLQWRSDACYYKTAQFRSNRFNGLQRIQVRTRFLMLQNLNCASYQSIGFVSQAGYRLYFRYWEVGQASTRIAFLTYALARFRLCRSKRYEQFCERLPSEYSPNRRVTFEAQADIRL